MGFCAQGPGPVIKITGTKERRQSHNAVGTWLKKKGEKISAPCTQKWKDLFFYFFKWTLQQLEEETEVKARSTRPTNPLLFVVASL